MPLVLGLAEGDHCDWTGEKVVSVAFSVVKHNPDLMGMVIIFIDQHKRPLTVRALVSVGRHHHVPLVILHIAGGREEAMLGVLTVLAHSCGRNNPPYMYFDSREFTNAPDGISNGITSGFHDESDLDYRLPYCQTGAGAHLS
jgi:hypothetical protein